MNFPRLAAWFLAAIIFGVAAPARGQWITQTNALKPGWNAVYLHVDASHGTIDQLVGGDPSNPIVEIWYWQPMLPTGQFVESPQIPTSGGSQWVLWSRLPGKNSVLKRLVPNGAYLVRVPANAGPYNWLVKGRPVVPAHKWTVTGLNFLGFPTPPNAPPSFEVFRAPSPELQESGEFFRYQGGELGPTNPVRVAAPRSTTVKRDQAFWVRAGEVYNNYFGPVQVVPQGSSAVRFGETRGQASVRLRNMANVPVTVTLRQLVSEPAPGGQTAVSGPLPLLVRGERNTTNLTFGFTTLSATAQDSAQWTLAPVGQTGSEVEVILGLNRSQMAGSPGQLFAGILRLTDSLGLSQIDFEASAVKESAAGLWVGDASVGYVGHYLKRYAQADSQAAFEALLARLQLGQGVNGYRYEWDAATGRILVFGGSEQKTGSYLLDGPIKVDSGTVAMPHQLRLIVHNDGTAAKLLQKVFHGVAPGSNTVLATSETLLHPGLLDKARRISSVHLPTSRANLPWNFSGTMQPGVSVVVEVPLSFDDRSSNPFLHSYHPDHDNLDALFASELPRGLESYSVKRRITLSFTAPGSDFNGLTRGSQEFGGNYAETITFEGRGTNVRQFDVLGTFALKRISDIATLTTQ